MDNLELGYTKLNEYTNNTGCLGSEPKDKMIHESPQHEILTSAAISERLFLEMCRSGKKAAICEGTSKEREINWYHAEGAKYARRASAGNFDGKNAKYKPVFHLDSKDFSPRLRAHLVERLNTSKESLHRVVEDAVFMIFRARHPMIFHQHIEAEDLRWRFV